MLESQLKDLPIKDLLALADKAVDLYVLDSVDPKNKKLAEQRQADLYILDKIISEKKENQTPLKYKP